MAATAATLTAGTAEDILDANDYRGEYTIQLQTDEGPVFLAFGDDASASGGITLKYPGDTVRVSGYTATLACSAYSASATPTIGIETAPGIEYVSGQFGGPWPTS